jgi:integrase
MGNWCYEIVKAWTDTFPDSRRNNPKTILFPPILCRRVFFDRPPMCDDNIYRIVRLYAEGAGLPLVTPHDLRRSFARLAEDNGAALREIQSSLGHSNIATTEIYLGSRQDFERSPGQLIHLDTEKGT